MIVSGVIAALALLIWTYLLVGRGMFWLCHERDDREVPPPKHWPAVTAIVPARDEADVIARSLGSLLAQDYPGRFCIVLIDDQSSDGTADIARSLPDPANRLTVLRGTARPSGWTGKVWAQQQGIAEAGGAPNYLLLTDADIAHAPDNLRQLVARAENGKRMLVSLMARLNCTTFAERFLIPAFVFFFAMLYPFSWSNNSRKRTAAAAGGCMLVRRSALEAAGGIVAIRNAIIDDCSLARVMKTQGPIWLGLTNRAISLRPYETLGDIRRMVARSAYAQLGYSSLMLAGTIFGMLLVYAAAPLFALVGHGFSRIAGLAAWFAMALAFQPTLRFYRVSPLWGLILPVIGFFYTAFTLDSALQFWRGKGGMWKGRAQAITA
jgi:hopene-associated glycosyltransferase HpnB